MTVSVVIPCHDRAGFIGAAIESVLAQTEPADEVIVVDDGSRDDSAAIAASFGHPVRVLRQSRQGVSAARNAGVAASRGDFVAVLDSDDLWLPRKLERQVAYLRSHPDVGAVGCDVALRDHGHDRAAAGGMTDARLRTLTAADLLTGWPVPGVGSTLLMRGAIARSVEYPAGVKDAEDVIHLALVRGHGPVGLVEECLAIYRMHPGQQVKHGDHWLRSMDSRLAWVRAHRGRLGASPDEVDARVFHGLAQEVLTCYWRRDTRRFRVCRAALLERWPASLPVPSALTRRVLPRPLLRLKDCLDDWHRRRREARG